VLGILWCKPQRGDDRRGLAWLGRAGRGVAWHGEATVADSSTEGLCSPCCSLWESGHGGARLGLVRFGLAGQSRVRRGDSCRQQQGAPRCSLLLSLESGQGLARLGLVRSGMAVSGGVWRGNSCRRQHRGFRAPLLLSSESRLGNVRWGPARQGEARRGPARQSKGRFGALSRKNLLTLALRGNMIALPRQLHVFPRFHGISDRMGDGSSL
jgi:hypothetical protein